MSQRVFTLIISAIFFAHFSFLVAAAETPQNTAVSERALMLAAAMADEKNNPSKSKTHAEISRENSMHSNFRDLDAETESVLKEVLNLSSDLSIIDERENNPAKFQLFVLVTMEPTAIFELDFIELRVDKQIVAAHHYTDLDISSMSRGGGHRLYLANLPAGLHHLKAKMVGKIPRDPDYRRDTSFSFISGVARTIVELSITGESSKGFPSIVPREWN